MSYAKGHRLAMDENEESIECMDCNRVWKNGVDDLSLIGGHPCRRMRPYTADVLFVVLLLGSVVALIVVYAAIIYGF